MKNILVTGSHRSGSTWIGKVLASGGEAVYVHEPFNIDSYKFWNVPLKHWYAYYEGDDDIVNISEYFDQLSYFNLQFYLAKYSYRLKKGKLSLLQDDFTRLKGGTRIFKDPIALFSAEYLAENLDLKVLVSIRHPAAFAESLKAKHWMFDFNNFLDQSKLVDGPLYPYKQEIKYFLQDDKKQQNIIEHAILLWNCIHFRILYYQNKYPEWVFIRHEDLSQSPENEFQKIFEKLGLSFNEKANKYLSSTIQGEGLTGINRDLKKNMTKWKERLSEKEIRMIYEGTKGISKFFYSEEEWN